MLSKLAYRNAKRSIKDYTIYLITVTLAFSFIFAFNLISNSTDIKNLSSIMENFKYAMYFVNIFIILVICFLINYTTKFMFSKRSKEFGTYMILGIKKKSITKMFTLENIILGFFAFLISVPIGYLFSLLMSLIITSIFELPYAVTPKFSFISLVLSLLYFTIIYIIVLFLARKRFKKLKICNLLTYERQNEKITSHKKIRNISFIISLILGITALYLFNNQFKSSGIEPSFLIILLSIILLIFSVYGLTFSISDFLLNFILKRPKLKYHKDNLFVARTYYSKAKTMSFTLGTITILIAFSLVALNISSIFKGMFDYQTEIYSPYDITINGTREEFTKYLDFITDNYTIKDKFIYDIYQDSNKSISNHLKNNYDWASFDAVIKLSDYNKLLELKGDKPVTLNQNEYLLHTLREYANFLNLKKLDTITLSNNQSLKLKEYHNEGYTTSWNVNYNSLIIVVPDSITNDLELATSKMIINTNEETTEQFAQDFTTKYEADFCDKTEGGTTICYSGKIDVRGETLAQNKSFTTITAFICFYIAFIFTAVVGTILAIEALKDSNKYKYRYQVLYKLGVQKRKLYKTIFKQLSIFFIFPLIYPLIISTCTIASMNKVFKVALSTDTIYLNYLFLNLFIFLIIYLIYFIATYTGFKKNINE